MRLGMHPKLGFGRKAASRLHTRLVKQARV